MLYPLFQIPPYANRQAPLSCASSSGMGFGGGVNLKSLSVSNGQV
jgi:hypothetical protein